MQVEITARNFTPSKNLRSCIATKVEKLINIDPSIYSSKLILHKEGRAEKIELIVSSKNKKYISKCYSSVFEKTLSYAIDKIKNQIYKSKKSSNKNTIRFNNLKFNSLD